MKRRGHQQLFLHKLLSQSFYQQTQTVLNIGIYLSQNLRLIILPTNLNNSKHWDLFIILPTNSNNSKHWDLFIILPTNSNSSKHRDLFKEKQNNKREKQRIKKQRENRYREKSRN